MLAADSGGFYQQQATIEFVGSGQPWIFSVAGGLATAGNDEIRCPC